MIPPYLLLLPSFALIPDAESNQRYKVTGEYDAENRVIYFDMTTAEASDFFKKPTE